MNNSNPRSSAAPQEPAGARRFSTTDYQIVQRVIRQRCTLKVLADPANPVQVAAGQEPRDAELNELVRQAIADSGWAPFHYDRKIDGIAEPWRFYILWRKQCLTIASKIDQWFDDLKPNNKIPAMLSACGALVLVNWLPQLQSSSVDADISHDKQIQINQEHLAATSAAIQNLLLLLTARNLGTYWSSGGLFRTETMFQKLGIDKSESLLGAIFVDYESPQTRQGVVERIPGKNRKARSDHMKWTREIVLD